MEFRVLGPLDVRVNGAPLPVRAPRQRAVLAALLLSANELVTVDRLVDAVWGSHPPASAVANLRSHVAALRRRLPEGRLIGHPGGYLLEVRPGELDLTEFTSLTQQGRYTEALALWRGELLENVTLYGAYEADVARLTEERFTVLENAFRTRLASGEHADLVGELRSLVVQHPLREQLWALLMSALHRSGRQADALAAYEEARNHLVQELGVEPSAGLRSAHEQILAGTTARSDLPADIADFTGRDAEIDRLLAAVQPGRRTATVVTIDGMGGIGKTTLAVRVAHRLAPLYPDGQIFLDLRAYDQGRPLLTASVALERLLRASGVPGEQIPEDPEERSALWRATLAGRRVLLVLDNADQVEHLLPGASGCLTIVTSRHRLTGVGAARVISLDVLGGAEAALLFERIVGDPRPVAEPDAVREVLKLCGYLPLAIRIAAARLRHRPAWTVSHLADRLRDHQQRADDVATVFSLSYRQLSPDQQRMFHLLGNHPGPDIEWHAAAALAGIPVHRAEELLEDLVDVHLLEQPTQGRYRLHDLARTYAAQLGHDSDATTRLFDHYLATASSAMDLVDPAAKQNRPVIGVFQGREDAVAWLEAERANLLAIAGRGPHTGALAATIAKYLDTRAYHDDAFALHQAALDAARQAADRDAEGTALRNLGVVYWRWGRNSESIEHQRKALDIARESGSRTAESLVLNSLGIVYDQLGRYDEALDHYSQASKIAEELGDRPALAYALNNIGTIAWQRGRHDEALRLYQQALAVADVDDRACFAGMLGNIGLVHRELGRYEEALQCLDQVLAIFTEAGQRNLQGLALANIGDIHNRMGDHTKAIERHRAALDIARETGNRSVEIEALNGLGEATRAAGDSAEALTHHRKALALADETGDRIEQARAHNGLASAHHTLGHTPEAHHHRSQAALLP